MAWMGVGSAGADGVVIGMLVGGDEAKRHRIVDTAAHAHWAKVRMSGHRIYQRICKRISPMSGE